jgi:biopolymer transport protein ExbD
MWINPGVNRKARVEMVPLIDLFFNVLIFFIFSVFWMQMQEGITVDLPSAATGESSRDDAATVSVDAAGALFFNREPVTSTELHGRLGRWHGEQPEATLRIHADRLAAHGSVMGVLDAARQTGIQHVAFETQPQER